MKFDFFFTLLENSLKKSYKIRQLALILHKLKRCIITATKRSITNFLFCRLQKLLTMFFMKFDFFFTLLENSLENLYKIRQLALILHKLKRCIITATKLSIIDFLTCLLQTVINKRSSWSSTFSSPFLKIL